MISFHRDRSFDPARYSRHFVSTHVEDLSRVATCMSRFAWSPIVWDGGVRLQYRFKSARYCVLDFDDPDMTLAQALNVFCDMRHVIGTTRNHLKSKNGNPPCDRFRVLLEFDAALYDLELYRHNMRRLASCYPVDSNALDGARFFYPCSEIVSVQDDGYLQEVCRAVPPKKAYEPRASDLEAVAMGHLPVYYIRKFTREYRPLNRHMAIYKFVDDCLKLGFSADAAIQKMKTLEVYNSVAPLDDKEIAEIVYYRTK